MTNLNRRDFLKLSGAAAASLNVPVEPLERVELLELAVQAPIERVRIGVVGVGLQGGSHVENFLKIPGCRITAVCDIREERTSWAQGPRVFCSQHCSSRWRGSPCGCTRSGKIAQIVHQRMRRATERRVLDGLGIFRERGDHGLFVRIAKQREIRGATGPRWSGAARCISSHPPASESRAGTS